MDYYNTQYSLGLYIIRKYVWYRRCTAHPLCYYYSKYAKSNREGIIKDNIPTKGYSLVSRKSTESVPYKDVIKLEKRPNKTGRKSYKAGYFAKLKKE